MTIYEMERKIFKPTMNLKWVTTNHYIPQLDSFEKILHQEWRNDQGDIEWREVDTE